MKEKILIFGTGSVSEYIYSKLDIEKVCILGFVRSTVLCDESFHGLPVFSTNKLNQIDFDFILIGSGYVNKIKGDLINSNIHEEKIVSFIFDDSECFNDIKDVISTHLNVKYNRDKLNSWLKNNENVPLIYPSVLWKDDISIKHIEKDFVREQTVKLISDQICSKSIPGEVAELGVFRGDFTVVINSCFPKKKLYLYDTFEGFSQTDLSIDSTVDNKIGEACKFKDTSVELVLNRLNHSSDIIVKKGYFPDSFSESNEKFCFVSVDLNLYKPVYDALEKFYPLLSEGGYILVSDYYAPFYSGTKDAVDEFCKKFHKTLIPVSDFYGSALIIKE